MKLIDPWATHLTVLGLHNQAIFPSEWIWKCPLGRAPKERYAEQHRMAGLLESSLVAQVDIFVAAPQRSSYRCGQR
jgi:hypothetical protein